MRVTKAIAFAALLAAAQVSAQEENTDEGQTRMPRCEDPAYRAFDFWIGEWEVRTPEGQLTGTNSIQPFAAHCALLERYTVNGQPAGQSYNFYDHVSGTWTQLWLSPGVIIRLEGPVGESGMLDMRGTITYANQPEPRGFRGRWTAQYDGTVLQEFWEQNPESGEWAHWFTGIYTRTD